MQASGLEYSQAALLLLKGMQAIMEDEVTGMDFGMDLSKLMGEQMQQSMAMMQQIMANYKTN
jgi:polyhydroxyalkanoate synthesis regulator protein